MRVEESGVLNLYDDSVAHQSKVSLPTVSGLAYYNQYTPVYRVGHADSPDSLTGC